MRTFLIVSVFLSSSLLAIGQTFSVSGEVIDNRAQPMQFSTVALLNPADSTLAHFALSNQNGNFAIAGIPKANFLLQVSFMGYKTVYKPLSFPMANNGDLGAIVLSPASVDLGEVKVAADRIPIQIRKDTIEFNADAFKTKPDAVAEDLLKKLPGVEVDRAGNVKAMGENVGKVLVDGKEFFSNDPKVATKNLPAESIDKVQVYNKKSDESELIGIDDSEYDKTINFVLKEGMKQAVFGDVKAGTDGLEYFQSGAKVYRFTEKHQFAALALLNNINKPGFSFQDYIDFNGGLRSMMGGGDGRIRIEADDDLPIDFGQPVYGKITSGAGGANYSYEIKPNNRFNISYMGNRTEKLLTEKSTTNQYSNSQTILQNADETSSRITNNHMFNVGWRNKASKRQHFMFNGIASFQQQDFQSKLEEQSFENNNFMNSIDNHQWNKTNSFKSRAEGSWMLKGDGNWKLLKVNGNMQYRQTLNNNEWQNIVRYFSGTVPVDESRILEAQNNQTQGEIAITGMRQMLSKIYAEPSMKVGLNSEFLSRQQGENSEPFNAIDSVSPKIQRNYQWMRPTLTMKYVSKKSKINFGFGYEAGQQKSAFHDTTETRLDVAQFLPEISWDYEYKTGRRFSAGYNTQTTIPTANQLQPIISASNPLMVYRGNPNLKESYSHNLFLSWFLFDQFSFTSVFASADAGYTSNSFGNSIRIEPDLRQSITLVNVADDYNASANIDFSTPIRPLKINVSLGYREQYNQTLSFVNDEPNEQTNLRHRIRLKFDNRKKEKWDIEVGGELSYSQSSYSVQQQLDRNYFNYNAFSEIRFTPTDRWHFRVTADITTYNQQSFGSEVAVPLLSAEVNFHFLKNRRAMLSLEGSDLLNRNTGISRTAQSNYLRETRSNTIGRFVMLSLKFKLNKTGSSSPGGIRIDTRR